MIPAHYDALLVYPSLVAQYFNQPETDEFNFSLFMENHTDLMTDGIDYLQYTEYKLIDPKYRQLLYSVKYIRDIPANVFSSIIEFLNQIRLRIGGLITRNVWRTCILSIHANINDEAYEYKVLDDVVNYMLGNKILMMLNQTNINWNQPFIELLQRIKMAI